MDNLFTLSPVELQSKTILSHSQLLDNLSAPCPARKQKVRLSLRLTPTTLLLREMAGGVVALLLIPLRLKLVKPLQDEFKFLNILEHSKSVWAVAPFLSPHPPVASYIPVSDATPPQTDSIRTKSSWQILATLWVAILACLAIGLRLKQPSSDFEVPHLSKGVHDYLGLSQKEGKE